MGREGQKAGQNDGTETRLSLLYPPKIPLLNGTMNWELLWHCLNHCPLRIARSFRSLFRALAYFGDRHGPSVAEVGVVGLQAGQSHRKGGALSGSIVAIP